MVNQITRVMKELSIEQKAQRYDEALKYARIYYKDGDEDMKMMMKTCFPVLAEEREDERIRKALLTKFTNEKKQGGKYEIHGVSIDNIISWLEKKSNESVNIDIESMTEAYKQRVINQSNGVRNNPLVNMCLTAFRRGIENTLEELNLKKLKKQGEQTSDKIEPKFKNGQWIVWQGKCYKVNDNGCGYELVDQDGLSTSLEYGTIDESAHLFDITKDAKDGDVLCCKSGWTCIFKALDNHTNTFSSYCFMDEYKWFCNTGSECHTLDERFIKAYNREISPAIKEQRDLLFQKMKEAGYEWSDKDRKLIKIVK